ncbi:hypothetical protein chiPu_0000228 [Chiloscyllium punctatum]|uniref:Uncharacterized protein n=1 Tax=Chiloscyllium punctatum TaxID=137246 RepID=A0A401RUP3_CHIPU|nr:hypothetical protein [Chiloscyllium punctatum]
MLGSWIESCELKEWQKTAGIKLILAVLDTPVQKSLLFEDHNPSYQTAHTAGTGLRKDSKELIYSLELGLEFL